MARHVPEPTAPTDPRARVGRQGGPIRLGGASTPGTSEDRALKAVAASEKTAAAARGFLPAAQQATLGGRQQLSALSAEALQQIVGQQGFGLGGGAFALGSQAAATRGREEADFLGQRAGVESQARLFGEQAGVEQALFEEQVFGGLGDRRGQQKAEVDAELQAILKSTRGGLFSSTDNAARRRDMEALKSRYPDPEVQAYIEQRKRDIGVA